MRHQTLSSRWAGGHSEGKICLSCSYLLACSSTWILLYRLLLLPRTTLRAAFSLMPRVTSLHSLAEYEAAVSPSTLSLTTAALTLHSQQLQRGSLSVIMFTSTFSHAW